MDLRINQQFGLIGLNIKQPSYELQISHARSDMEVTSPRLKIDQEYPRVEIDQTQCFADVERRDPMEFSRHIARLSSQAGFEGIAQIAAEGDLLASIEDNIDIADIAIMNSQLHDEFNVGLVPEHQPVIRVIRGNIHIEAEPGSVKVRPLMGQVQSQLDWGKVGVVWQQKPGIDIEYTGGRLDVSA